MLRLQPEIFSKLSIISRAIPTQLNIVGSGRNVSCSKPGMSGWLDLNSYPKDETITLQYDIYIYTRILYISGMIEQNESETGSNLFLF